ncbi:hypothetical protein TREMEDRAFT_67999 [Tremella mesenterica DSM 1558]|uniref:uncharacterized protein n=1 Tax=Tremella mesenterica (strain ATCC 24925 / CBS 8224 / DSM 1558 / NBRC 9311 / NRRL Y-6157 / RJB 2259-6 / UBC 559-6) TaxID=578456 RepID=UPI0003F490B9|nr:uncharacterized protein TREMEDRAFT_67999 [Tremella mesenterica DSM 1558]EIW70325.1 hypothetical protein TREMEDRAFT_67999 [Tremella mesenterica DSM 1558]
MEKFSKWRDPATGIQPFLPPVAPNKVNPVFKILLYPSCVFHSLVRGILLGIVAILHILLVNIICFPFILIPQLHYLLSTIFTTITTRLSLFLMGYWSIPLDIITPKRTKTSSVSQSLRSPLKGDLIISNWTSYVDIIYLTYKFNPTFLLPIFSPSPPPKSALTGKHTGTGSAQLISKLPQPSLLGYIPLSLFSLLFQTGSLPTIHSTTPKGMYKSLQDARKKCLGPIVLLPECTTSNGRALLRFPEGLLSQEDIGDKGLTWIIYLRHSSPTPFAPSATCPLPQPFRHLFGSLLFTPTPMPQRSLGVRMLHPSASPSSPSFLPSEILADHPGGLEGLGKNGEGVWREAVSVVLAETGKVRRVKGMGWVEKEGFLEYWNTKRR